MSKAAPSSTPSPELAAAQARNRQLEGTVDSLEDKVASLEQQLDWFKRQLFGRKSEKRRIEDLPEQPLLAGLLDEEAPGRRASGETEDIQYTRKKRRGAGCATDSGLRFDESVPKKTIRVSVPELEGPDAGQYEVISEKRTYRLAQRVASYVVLEYIHPVIKHRATQTLRSTPAPPALWAGTVADVSFVAGLLVEKLVYHQPLYRQHQRLERDGIHLARGTLSQYVHRAIRLLEPVYEALLEDILRSKVLAIDETPIKAGRGEPGKMKLGWYWPVYGEHDQVAFTFSQTRGRRHLDTLLAGFTGTYVTDGHSAYRAYAKACPEIAHAQCWSHSRREFIKAEKHEPEAVAEALDLIGTLYQVEAHIRDKNLGHAATLACRTEHARPALDAFFEWCERQCQRLDLVPSNPLSKALAYVRGREDSLRLYLSDPDIPIDTNHLERALRVIPMGRKSWLFCWTEIGAERIGIAQSLLTTCRLHDVHPFVYLVDVLQRIDQHPASRVHELTPRNWKKLFAHDPLVSDLQRG